MVEVITVVVIVVVVVTIVLPPTTTKPGASLNIKPGSHAHDCRQLLLALALSKSTGDAPKLTVSVHGS